MSHEIYTRIYFWFKGADPNRLGGAWWYKDFRSMNRNEIESFIDCMKPFCIEIKKIVANRLKDHDPMEICPPDKAVDIPL